MVRARPRSDRSMWRAALRSEAHGATACLRGSRLTMLTPKDFLRIGSHREILCLAIQHDKGPNRRFRWSGAWSSVSTQSAPGGTRTPNLLIRNTRRGQTSGPEVPPRDGDRWLASGHEGRGWGQVGVSSIIRRWVHPVGSQRRREAQNEALRLTGQTARRPDKEKIS